MQRKSQNQKKHLRKNFQNNEVSNGVVSGISKSDLILEDSFTYDSAENGMITSDSGTLEFYMPTADRLMIASSSVGNAVSMIRYSPYSEEPQYTSNSWVNGNLMSGITAGS